MIDDPNIFFKRGLNFENHVKKYLEKKSWVVVKNTKSALPDLLAVKKGKILLVECKISNNISRSEKARLINYSKKAGGIPLLATQFNDTINLFQIKDYFELEPFLI
jgi:Holliday junction resolvase